MAREDKSTAVVVAKSGKIYLSDATTRFAPKDWGGTFEASILDIMELSSTGRILEYDPVKKETRVPVRALVHPGRSSRRTRFSKRKFHAAVESSSKLSISKRVTLSLMPFKGTSKDDLTLRSRCR